MTDVPPSSTTVRRSATLIVIAYGAPVVLTIATLVVHALSSDGRPLALFATFLAFGAVLPLARHLSNSIRSWRRAHERLPGPVDAGTRKAIAVLAPGLAELTMLVAGSGLCLRVDGRRLMVGAAWLGPDRPGRPNSDQRLFAMAHEERHQAVRAFPLLRWFRLIRRMQVSAAGAIYTGFMLNAAGAFDDDGRVVLIVGLACLPYIPGMLQSVLDEASNALEWRLEFDADAAGVRRCLEAGRPAGIPLAMPLASLFDRANAHGPVRLRERALGGQQVDRAIRNVLVTGWLAVTLPLVALALSASATTDHPRYYNAMLDALLVAGLLGAVTALSTAALPVGDLNASVRALVLRVYVAANRSLALAMVVLTFVLVADVTVTAWHGVPPTAPDFVSTVGCATSAAIYAALGAGRFRTGWILAATVTDATRLWLTAWLLRASGVLPFYDDLEALGTALGSNPGIIGHEMSRMWESDRAWLAGLAVGCVTAAGAIGLLAAWVTTESVGRKCLNSPAQRFQIKP